MFSIVVLLNLVLSGIFDFHVEFDDTSLSCLKHKNEIHIQLYTFKFYCDFSYSGGK